MISLDELVLDMRDIMELSYIFHYANDKLLLNEVYTLLKAKLEKFYKECYLVDTDIINDSLFYAVSLIKAYQDDEVLKKMAVQIKKYVINVRNDSYINSDRVIK